MVKWDMVISLKIVYYINMLLIIEEQKELHYILGGKRNGKFIVEEYQQDLSERFRSC